MKLAERWEMTRRQLLKGLGGGLLFAVFPSWACAKEQRGQQVPQEVDAWLHISQTGEVTAMTGKVEVGQNARTSVTQAVAEELRVPASSVKVVMGDTDLVPYDRGTFGSQTTPQMIPQIRRAAATAREALIDMAAERLGVVRSSLTAANGVVSTSGSGGSVSYGELAGGKPLGRDIPRGVALTPVEDWSVMGTSLPKVDGEAFVTGLHKFASDVSVEGTLHAKVLRAPRIGARLASADTSGAEAMSGVRVVSDDSFVAVAAPTLRLAEKALVAIKATWEGGSDVGTADLPALFGVDTSQSTAPAAGDVNLSNLYTCAYIAHAPLEPRAALATWDGTKATVYTGSQRPFGVRSEIARALSVSEESVRVLIPDTGSGYGGKHSGDAAVEAARISRALGVPIKLVWTREEEFEFAYYRPGGAARVGSSANSDGRLVAWSHECYNAGGSALECPYDVRNPQTRTRGANAPIRQGSYRGLAATFNNFARESHMDEVADALGVDRVEFRLRNLRDERMIAVLKACAAKFGWPATLPSGSRGVGIACGTEKGSYVATAAEVEVSGSNIKVVRAVTAYECGKILNPDLLLSQVDGAVVQGLGGALFEQARYSGGVCETDRFSLYRLPRYSDTPKMDTVLLDRPDLDPAGAGETPIMAIAPAVNGAVFQATGKRLRSMPLERALAES